jgi:Spherulation-specific family 4
MTTQSARQRRLLPTLAAALLAAAATVLAPQLRPAEAAVRPNVAVPAYFWDNAQWDRLLIGASEVDYVVLNPDSGPGAVKYQTFVPKVATARSQGAIVLGYVDTNYGTRAASAVKADIDKYRLWYGVNAFFFDQTPSSCVDLPYYTALSTYVRAQANAVVFHNPGTNPEECYLAEADVVVNFEGSESTYATWAPDAYVANYPASRFWHIVYAVDPSRASQVLDAAQSRNGGLVYLTEQLMPNPFSVIPTAVLWSAQTPSVVPRPAAPQAGVATTSPGRPAAPQSGPNTTTTTTVPPGASPAGTDSTPTTIPASAPGVPTSVAPPTTLAPPPLPPTTLAPTTPSLVAPIVVPPAPVEREVAPVETSTAPPTTEAPPASKVPEPTAPPTSVAPAAVVAGPELVPTATPTRVVAAGPQLPTLRVGSRSDRRRSTLVRPVSARTNATKRSA